MIIKTDRVIEPIVEPKVETVTEPMTPNKGGGGFVTQKQMIYTIVAIVVIAVVIVVGVYLYKRYQKSPLNVQ